MTDSNLRAAALASFAVATVLMPLAVRADTTLDEIVVTAQRRNERLQDVPLAVSALSASDLIDRGVRQAADIAASVPNMLLNLPYGPEAQPTFTLRGVTTQDYSQNQSSPIAMYVDEIYKPVGAVQALQTYDLDRVEVLRGPQGTLYGASAEDGVVRVITSAADLQNFDVKARLSDGTTEHGGNNYQGDLAINVPLIDGKLAARAVVGQEDLSGRCRQMRALNRKPGGNWQSLDRNADHTRRHHAKRTRRADRHIDNPAPNKRSPVIDAALH